MERTVAQGTPAAASDMVKAIDPAELTDGQGNRAFGGGRLGGIGGKCADRLTQFSGRGSDVLRVAANQNQARPAPDKGARGRQSQAGGAADNDDALPVQIELRHVGGQAVTGSREKQAKRGGGVVECWSGRGRMDAKR